MAEENSVIINSVDRALDILLYLYNQGTETAITKISTDLGIYKSTVYRTLATLQNKEFVSQNPENGKYSLGIKFFIIGTSIGEKVGITKVVKPFAKMLYDEFHEAVNVSILEKNPLDVYRSVIVYKEENNQILQFNSQIGSRNECHCAGVGKCLLAFGENVDLSVYEKYPMASYTERTIVTRADLEHELTIVREQGYALDDEEREIGLTCIGVPIMMNGHAVAAISLSGPTTRIKYDRYQYKIDRLCEIGRQISVQLK